MSVIIENKNTPDENKIFVLLRCWYEGDHNLVDDGFIAASRDISELEIRAKERHKDAVIYLPGQAIPDDGCSNKRYRIIKALLIKNKEPALKHYIIEGLKNGDVFFQCSKCHLEYKDIVNKCTGCGVILERLGGSDDEW